MNQNSPPNQVVRNVLLFTLFFYYNSIFLKYDVFQNFDI